MINLSLPEPTDQNSPCDVAKDMQRKASTAAASTGISSTRLLEIVVCTLLIFGCVILIMQRVEPRQSKGTKAREARNAAINSLKLAIDQGDIALAQTVFDFQIDRKVTSKDLLPLLEQLIKQQRLHGRKTEARTVAAARIDVITLHHNHDSPEVLAALHEFCLDDLHDNSSRADTTWIADRAVGVARLRNDQSPYGTTSSNLAMHLITRAMVNAVVYPKAEQSVLYMKEARQLARINHAALSPSFLAEFWIRAANFYKNKNAELFEEAVEAVCNQAQRRGAVISAQTGTQINALRNSIQSRDHTCSQLQNLTGQSKR